MNKQAARLMRGRAVRRAPNAPKSAKVPSTMRAESIWRSNIGRRDVARKAARAQRLSLPLLAWRHQRGPSLEISDSRRDRPVQPIQPLGVIVQDVSRESHCLRARDFSISHHAGERDA